MSGKLIAVTGSTGFVGRYVVRALLARGHRVSALVRDMRKAELVLPDENVSLVKGDVNDRAALDALLEGADAAIHLIGIRRETGRDVTFHRMHVVATRNVLEAALDNNVPRHIQMSALGTRAEARSRYHQTKHEAETLVRGSGLDWTILRPSIIHGPDGEFMEMAAGWVRGEEMPKRFLPYFFPTDPTPNDEPSARVQPIAVTDCAAAFAEAVDNERTIGEIYCLGGADWMTWPDLLTTIQRLTPGADESLKPRGVSGPFASYLAQAAKILGVGALLPFGPDEPLMAVEDQTCDLSKPRKHFGFDPAPFEDTVRSYAKYL
jgi:NADH dehydrogenase